MNSFVRLPATDLPGVVGFFLMTAISMAVLVRIPGLNKIVK